MSLFGQPNQPVQPSSLFGGGSSLGTQGNMPAASVFGASTQSSSGMFSGFPAQNQQQPAQQSTLFGGTQMSGNNGLLGQNPNQGSLFGSKYNY